MVEQQSVRDPTEDVPDGGRGHSIVRLCNVCTERAGRTVMRPEIKFSKKGKKFGRCEDCAERAVQANIARGQRKSAIAKRERREVAAARAESLRHEMRRRLVAVVPVAVSEQQMCPPTLPPPLPILSVSTPLLTQECVICHDQCSGEHMTLVCGHQYHASCITTWLTRQRSCPVCRRCVYAIYASKFS